MNPAAKPSVSSSFLSKTLPADPGWAQSRSADSTRTQERKLAFPWGALVHTGAQGTRTSAGWRKIQICESLVPSAFPWR